CIFLTLGIAMWFYGAYSALGWGGRWFWDPVETASLMPGLAGTALLHSAIVMEKREAMKVWTILLSILTFALSLLGTFLVRSGVLTSVHAFASDPARGIFILIIMVGFVGGALALYAWRAPTLRQGGVFAPISREGALVLNNLFLSTMAAAVLVGTLYPLALEALTGEKISVGPPFFNATFGPLAVPLLLLVPFGPLLAWKRGDALAAAQRLMAAAGFAALGGLMAAAIVKDGPWLAPFGVALGLWLIMGALTEVALRVGLFRLPIGTVFSRAAGLPRSAWGTALAHFGIGVVVLGIVGETAWKTEYIGTMAAGDSVDIAKNHVTLTGFETRKGPNYQEQTVHFDVVRPNGTTMKVEAAKRFYPVRRMPTTEAALVERLSGDLYVTLGDPQDDGRIVVRIFYKPLVILIWLGAVVMALGGMLSLSDRRLRVGAPRTARARRPDATLAPAE
ncbi:MAG: heme lyase CcmF/NrfE family subunit, partial [Rhodobiaceae bacterium]|nr:heme lyase CcmF/NrfE family subunit [Rhodobiaceae bacterium]